MSWKDNYDEYEPLIVVEKDYKNIHWERTNSFSNILYELGNTNDCPVKITHTND